jgi:tetratricopeptide (TPR) repeat protein
MNRRALVAVAAVLALAGCATGLPETDGAVARVAWLDRDFAYDPAAVKVQREDLFRLDPELQAKLAEPAMRDATSSSRMRRLLTTIFGPDLKAFAYVAGNTTTAGETWRNRKGDCLSLTVLTYSVARALGMPARMQEVQTPAIFDRRGELDVVNQHVNVMFMRSHFDLLEEFNGRDLVVDFEPDFASGRRGTLLTEDGILARYYNNVAVENMAAGRPQVAYAHFRAAIAADAGYVSAYSNLAVLYRRAGRDTEAEQLLRHALAMPGIGNPDVALHELHRLLVDQRRMTEARQLERLLEARRSEDPYYWTGLGLKFLQDGDARRAVNALEKARDLAPRFSEVHRYLAVAYTSAGKPKKAEEELATLASLGTGLDKISMLRRKLAGSVQAQ